MLIASRNRSSAMARACCKYRVAEQGREWHSAEATRAMREMGHGCGVCGTACHEGMYSETAVHARHARRILYGVHYQGGSLQGRPARQRRGRDGGVAAKWRYVAAQAPLLPKMCYKGVVLRPESPRRLLTRATFTYLVRVVARVADSWVGWHSPVSGPALAT